MLRLGMATAADAKGNVYFAGMTNDAQLGQPLSGPLGGAGDVIVGRLNPKGKLLNLVRLGGDREDVANGIALDASDNVYLTGSTRSENFPTTEHAFQQDKPRSGDINFDVPNAFVTKLSSDLSKMLYSTYLGGSQGVSVQFPRQAPSKSLGGDDGYDIAVDKSGAAYVVGRTASADFPTLNAVQAAHSPVTNPGPSGGYPTIFDAFVAKLDPKGSNLVFSTYLGGSGQDAATGVAVDRLGNAYVVGTTDSSDFKGAAPTF